MSERHAFRAKWHDYNGGIYFVTICAHEKRHILGHIVGAQYIAPTSTPKTTAESKFIPSALGHIIEKYINEIPLHHPNCEVWNYVIMPNHIHLVLNVGAQYIAPTEQVNHGCLSPPKHGDMVEDNHFNSALAIAIRTFKAAVTHTARAQCIAPLPIWQRNYHEHIIRNQRAFDNIMNYIDNNVINWHKDCFYS